MIWKLFNIKCNETSNVKYSNRNGHRTKYRVAKHCKKCINKWQLHIILTETVYWWWSMRLYFCLPMAMSHRAHNDSQSYGYIVFFERGSSNKFSTLDRDKSSNESSHAYPFRTWGFPGFFYMNSPFIHKTLNWYWSTS